MEVLLKIENLESLIQQSKVLILQFGTSTCTPCVAIKQKIDNWSKDHINVTCKYISIEEFPEIAAKQDVFSAPTILVFVEGKMTIRETGYFSLDEIFQRTERYLRLLG